MGKKFVDLSHPFGADIPLWPYFSKPVVDTMHGQAKSGVLSQKVNVVMHAGTHPTRRATLWSVISKASAPGIHTSSM